MCVVCVLGMFGYVICGSVVMYYVMYYLGVLDLVGVFISVGIVVFIVFMVVSMWIM